MPGEKIIRIVAENSEAELARQRAMAEVSWALREMTSNLMRVIRGAGKPGMIGQHTQAFIQALVSYRDAAGMMPSPEDLTEILSVDEDPKIIAVLENPELRRVDAKQRIVRGALQLAASRLVGQKTQESAGEHEMYDGIIAIEALRDEGRRERTQGPADRDGARRSARPPRKPRI